MRHMHDMMNHGQGTISGPRVNVLMSSGLSIADRSVVVHGKGAWTENNESGEYSLSAYIFRVLE